MNQATALADPGAVVSFNLLLRGTLQPRDQGRADASGYRDRWLRKALTIASELLRAPLQADNLSLLTGCRGASFLAQYSLIQWFQVMQSEKALSRNVYQPAAWRRLQASQSNVAVKLLE